MSRTKEILLTIFIIIGYGAFVIFGIILMIALVVGLSILYYEVLA